MKKKKIITSAILIGTMLMSGCGKGETESAFVATEKLAEQYMTLGDYEGLELTKYITPISEEDVELAKEEFMEDYRVETEVTGRTIQVGDYVNTNLTYEEDGNTEDYGEFDVTIGEEEISAQVDEELTGHNIGDIVSVVDDSEGSVVTYTFEITGINEVSYPEYNDSFVKENTDYSSTAEFEEYLRNKVAQENDESSVEELRDSALSAVVEVSEYKDFTKKMEKVSYEEVKKSHEEYAAMFGMELSDLVSEDDLNSYAVLNIQEKLAVQALVKAENIVKDEENYQEFLNRYMEYAEVTTEDELYEYYTKQELEDDYYREKALDKVIEKAKVTEKEAEAELEEE